jgi:hypothetical protein
LYELPTTFTIAVDDVTACDVTVDVLVVVNVNDVLLGTVTTVAPVYGAPVFIAASTPSTQTISPGNKVWADAVVRVTVPDAKALFTTVPPTTVAALANARLSVLPIKAQAVVI